MVLALNRSIIGLLAFVLCLPARAGDNADEAFMDLSLEELLQLEVTSVGRKSQRRSDVPAAVYVITHEEIRRSGVTSIPEALRLAPGVEVARVDSNKWAISARGFNGRFANKLQVLMDGRSIYTPTFSGVYWDVQDYPLTDIDRIEVIRGPGASLWGANAVNGVINIITKKSDATLGGEFQFGTGTVEKRFGSLRYGTRLGEHTAGRVYAQGFARGSFDQVGGGSGEDDWESYRGGFRVDHTPGNGDELTLQGDLYKGDEGQNPLLPTVQPPYFAAAPARAQINGGNVLGRWRRALNARSDIALQIYYDHTYRNEPVLRESRDTFDIDFQHHLPFGEIHDVVWGLNYRWTHDDFSHRQPTVFDTRSSVRRLFSAFVQDEISLIPETLKLTVGAKLEHNDFTGVEGQPSFRLAWTPNPQHTLWGAISRAVRTPARVEDSAVFRTYTAAPGSRLNPSFLPVVFSAEGNAKVVAEVLWAYELGYRFMPAKTFSIDTALFYNDYDHLRNNANAILSAAQDENGAYIGGRTRFTNTMRGSSYGAEIAVDWLPYDWWHLQLNYSYLRLRMQTQAGEPTVFEPIVEGSSPQHQVSLRSGFKLTDDVDFNLWLRYVDRLPATGFPVPELQHAVPDYLSLDLRLAWRPVKDLELSVVGQNLLDPRHPEFGQELYPPRLTQIPRGVYGALNWRF